MSLFLNRGRLLRRVIGGVAIAAALVACGGGTSQYDAFDPGRVIVFGDENSLPTRSGLFFPRGPVRSTGASSSSAASRNGGFRGRTA